MVCSQTEGEGGECLGGGEGLIHSCVQVLHWGSCSVLVYSVCGWVRGWVGWGLIHSCPLRPSVHVRMEIGSGFTVDAENETTMAVLNFCFKYVFSSSPLTPPPHLHPRLPTVSTSI